MRKPHKFSDPAPMQPVTLLPEVGSSTVCGDAGSYQTVTIGIRVDAREYADVLRELEAWHKSRAMPKRSTDSG